MIGSLAGGLLVDRAGRRAVPYMRNAEWRRGSYGAVQPAPPRRTMPAPNPVLNAARAPELRVRRAAALRAAAYARSMARRVPYRGR